MKSLEPEIKTLLFTNETGWIERAKELGIDTASNYTYYIIYILLFLYFF